jgi:aminopeptidase N
MLSVALAVAVASILPPSPGVGISEVLARARASVVRDLRYEVRFVIPDGRADRVSGRVVIRFMLDRPRPLALDFAQPRGAVLGLRSSGRPVEIIERDGHILLPASAVLAGANAVEVEFTSGDEALNRGDDLLYTLFVPARAHLAFPCFDQPDLKARYSLSLEVPAGWQAVTNGRTIADEAVLPVAPSPASPAASSTARSSVASVASAGRRRVSFAETEPLSTYLFAFVAGRFSVETATRGGRDLRMFHRETDAAKVARNRDAIFDLHASSLAWLEEYTVKPYPWGKFDFVLIPSFQFGGMEHAGAILYNASGLMLDESATQNQLLGRASVIAHETSHMWFGDLVTMRWFNDVWMKEVFANFMASKIVNPSFPDLNHDLRFLLEHYQSAYQVDRTAGTNPIRQSLGNLNEAGQMYGPIIYQKAPIIMRQLELMLGEAAMRDGLRDYLGKHAFGNATWLDLVQALDARTPRNLAAWSRAWVSERGRPEYTTAVRSAADGRLAAITLTSRDPLRRGLSWPQRLRVTLGYAGATTDLMVDVAARVTAVPGARGLKRPLYVLPNGGGLGYGLFVLDEASRTYLLDHIEDVPDALTRGSAWVTLWENALDGRIAPSAFFDAALRAVASEPDEQNVQRLLSNLSWTFWKFLTPPQRTARTAGLEAALRGGLSRGRTASQKAAWFGAYRDTVLSPEGVAWLERVWRREERIAGLTLAEPDEIAMASELAVREVPGWEQVLAVQLERTQNPDRKARFAFVMPALSADPAARERAFERFRDVANRRREPWVTESLGYLNHPLRAEHARRFVLPALELLREIQRTGDIFFPTRWMESTLRGHRSPEVAATVRAFLARERQYPQRLRWTVLSAADDLFRAARAPAFPPLIRRSRDRLK